MGPCKDNPLVITGFHSNADFITSHLELLLKDDLYRVVWYFRFERRHPVHNDYTESLNEQKNL